MKPRRLRARRVLLNVEDHRAYVLYRAMPTRFRVYLRALIRAAHRTLYLGAERS